MEKAEELRQRSKLFALRVIRMFKFLPRTEEAKILGKQILRAGTSTAANYRAACRARSKAEFVSKMGIVVEEIDETVFWLELLVESEIVEYRKIQELLKEANELLAIFASSRKTARSG